MKDTYKGFQDISYNVNFPYITFTGAYLTQALSRALIANISGGTITVAAAWGALREAVKSSFTRAARTLTNIYSASEIHGTNDGCGNND